MNFDVPITIALSKGRIFKETLPLLQEAGIEALDDPETSRKLILDTNHEQIKLVIIRATDVPTYVQWGAADIGVAGKDVLVEHGGEGIYELRIATKYVNAARAYFASRGQQVDIIKLYGSMELAPLVGLSDLIVDLVESGNTLKANGLVPLQHISDISSRLVVNRASWKTKHSTIKQLMDILEKAVEDRK